MGIAKKRVQPVITSFVNRNLEELFIKQLTKIVNKLPEPWSVDPRGKPHLPRVVLMCLILKIFWVCTYEGVEAKLKANKALLCSSWNIDKLPTHSVIHEAMDKVTHKFKFLKKLVADAGYLSRENCVLVGERNGKPYIWVREHSKELIIAEAL